MATEDSAAHESDEALVSRIGEGDKDAFAELYERHHRGLYDFAVRILREPESAADVVQATFTRAWPALRDGTRPSSVKAWLYGIARNLSIDELRRRRRVFPSEGLGLGLAELPDPAAFDPSETVETKELAELVWTSAAGLRAEEYALLDLHVRRGLSADELADSLGLRRGAVYTRLTRLRTALESAVVTSLLLRHGRGRCAELDRLVVAHRAEGSIHESRRVFQAHVEDCARCQESKGLIASPTQILAGLALVPPPDELADAVWAILGAGLAGAGAIAATGKAGGLGGLVSSAPLPVGLAAGGFATLATVAALGVWMVGGGDATTKAAPTAPAAPRAAPPASPPPAANGRAGTRAGEGGKPSTRSRPTAVSRGGRLSGSASAQGTQGEVGSARRSVPAPPLAAPPPPPSASAPPPPRPPAAPAPRRSGPQPPATSPPPPTSPPAPSPPAAPAPPPPAPRPPPPAPPPPPPAEHEKVAVCLNGNTLLVPSKAVPGLLKAGATLGACSIVDDG